jgi:lipoprotein-anchoring transpeptidase ErfK/SrfK
MGASLNARFQHRSSHISTLLTAGAAIALLAGASTNADAFPFDFSSGSQSSAPTYSHTQRATPPRARKPARTKRAAEVPLPADSFVSKAKAPLQIIISLDKQKLTLYSGNEAIAHSRVSTGKRGHATPTGVFSVIQRDRWHRSNLYDDAPMYFMQRITWSGVALHQGFVPNYAASHGCIRMPAGFAQQLWRVKSMGTRVIVSHGDVSPAGISHPFLFVPKPEPAVASIEDSLQAAEKAWQIAYLDTTKTTDALTVMTDVPTTPTLELPPLPNTRTFKRGPVSVFISRKTGKLYVRKGFEPILESPVTIEQPDQPLGTHVFTAVAVGEDSANWTVVTMTPKTSAAAALDRISIPQDVRDRVSTLMSDGASLIVSDKGMSSETGKGTDFIVVNP